MKNGPAKGPSPDYHFAELGMFAFNVRNQHIHRPGPCLLNVLQAELLAFLEPLDLLLSRVGQFAELADRLAHPRQRFLLILADRVERTQHVGEGLFHRIY